MSVYELDPGTPPYTNEGSTIIIDVEPRQGPTLIIPGMIIRGDTGMIIAQVDYDFPDIVIYGYVNVIDNTYASGASGITTQRYSRSFFSNDGGGAGFLVNNVTDIGDNEYTLIHDTSVIPNESNATTASDIIFEVWLYALNINATATIPVAIKWSCTASAVP